MILTVSKQHHRIEKPRFFVNTVASSDIIVPKINHKSPKFYLGQIRYKIRFYYTEPIRCLRSEI
jgi:hypothetical protein